MHSSLLSLRLWATGTLVAVALVGGGGMALFPGGNPRAAGVALALVLVLPSYWSLSLTLRRSNTQFFGAFVGGVLGRMAGLGLGGVIVWSHARAALIPFVLSAVIGLMGLSFIELFFIGRQNRLPI